MTTNYRALCAELLDELDLWSSWHDAPDLKARTKAALAQPEPEGPTDDELLRVAATAIAPYEISGITPGAYEPETECCVEAYGSELIAYARAVLAKWGHQ